MPVSCYINDVALAYNFHSVDSLFSNYKISEIHDGILCYTEEAVVGEAGDVEVLAEVVVVSEEDVVEGSVETEDLTEGTEEVEVAAEEAGEDVMVVDMGVVEIAVVTEEAVEMVVMAEAETATLEAVVVASEVVVVVTLGLEEEPAVHKVNLKSPFLKM